MFSAMFWGCNCISNNLIGTYTGVDGNINSKRYIDILDENLWPVLAWHFPNNDYLFQENNALVYTSNDTKQLKKKTKTISNRLIGNPGLSYYGKRIANIRTIKIRLKIKINDIKQISLKKRKEIWSSLSRHYI